jgi:hypothetical protein
VSAAQMYLPQVLCLVGLSFLTALVILVTRIADVLGNKRPLSFRRQGRTPLGRTADATTRKSV